MLPGFWLVEQAHADVAEANPVDPEQPSKRCTKCGVFKPIDRYSRDRRARDGRMHHCRDCCAAYARARRQDPVVRARLQALWRRSYACRREELSARARAENEQLRTEVLLAYGHRCDCCAETVREFLAIDHIRGGGNQHRKSTGLIGRRFYAWLKRHGFPRDDFRLLCHNCNVARSLRGRCPHETLARV